MQRKYVLAYMLFSLSLFLFFVSCFSPSSGELSKLASEQRYAELAKKTEAMLARRITSEPLYYRSLALQASEPEEAFHLLNLYFAMAKGDDQHVEGAHRLMTTLSLETKAVPKLIRSARWLEERSLLSRAEAGPYYQGLLLAGEGEEATRVFAQYLKDTIDPYTYAEMLLRSSLSEEKLTEAFAVLSFHERLTLLQRAASDRVNPEKATLLLELAIPLEQAFEDSPYLGQVYRLLEILYGYADLRVQGRKYSTLAQNFT